FAETFQTDLPCPVPRRKIFRFAIHPNQHYLHAHPAPNKGRFAIVTNVVRDAVDADSALDETRLRRTAKSCGPDAPTLASSFREMIAAARVARKPGHPGEREGNR